MLISDKKEENAMEKNLTTGSVFKNVILFSLPYLLSYFLQTLYGMADLFIIGQYDGVRQLPDQQRLRLELRFRNEFEGANW